MHCARLKRVLFEEFVFGVVTDREHFQGVFYVSSCSMGSVMSRCSFTALGDDSTVFQCTKEHHEDGSPHSFDLQISIPVSYKNPGSHMRDILRVVSRKRLADTCPPAQNAMDHIRAEFRYAVLMAKSPEDRETLDKLLRLVEAFNTSQFAARSDLRTAWVEHLLDLVV
jgi:hypothetical protein